MHDCQYRQLLTYWSTNWDGPRGREIGTLYTNTSMSITMTKPLLCSLEKPQKKLCDLQLVSMM